MSGAGKRLFDHDAVPSFFRRVDHETTNAGATALTLHPTQFGTGNFVVHDGSNVPAVSSVLVLRVPGAGV